MKKNILLLSIISALSTNVMASDTAYPIDQSTLSASCGPDSFMEYTDSHGEQHFGIMDLNTGLFTKLYEDTNGNQILQSGVDGLGFTIVDDVPTAIGYDSEFATFFRIQMNDGAATFNVEQVPTTVPSNAGFAVAGPEFIAASVGPNNKLYALDKTAGLFVGDVSSIDSISMTKTAFPFEGQQNAIGDFVVSQDEIVYFFIRHRADGESYVLSSYDLNTGETQDLELEGDGLSGELTSASINVSFIDGDGNLYIHSEEGGDIWKVKLTNDDGDLIKDGVHSFGLYSKTIPQLYWSDVARCNSAVLAPLTDTTKYPYGFSESGGTVLSNLYPAAWASKESESHLFLFDYELNSYDSNGDGETTSYAFEDDFTFAHDRVYDLGLDVPDDGENHYLSLWIDFNGDKDFDDDGEELIELKPLVGGMNKLSFEIPADAPDGHTILRMRTTTADLEGDYIDVSHVGGAALGEVADYDIVIGEIPRTKEYYPSAGTFATVAFEDYWPYQSDYDFNDVVIKYRTEYSYERNEYGEEKLVKVELKGKVAAYGGDLHNGFAVELAGWVDENNNDAREKGEYKYIAKQDLAFDTESFPIGHEREGELMNPLNDQLLLRHNKHKVIDNPFTAGIDESYALADGLADDAPVVVRIINDIKGEVDAGNIFCPSAPEHKYYRTVPDCAYISEDFEFDIVIPVNYVARENVPPITLKPFIYGTGGKGRSVVAKGNVMEEAGLEDYQSNQFEIHLKNNAPTTLGFRDSTVATLASAETNNFGVDVRYPSIGEDNGDGFEYFYQNDNGMSWGLLLTDEFAYPSSGLSIKEAYPHFADFIKDENDSTFDNWQETYPSILNGIITK